MEKEKTIIIVIIAVILVILCGICAYGLFNQNKEVLRIDDLNLEQDQFGIYNLKGHITALKDFDYLEARIVIYDDNGVVIGKSSCAWNTAHVKKDDTLSVGNGLGVTCDGDKPAYAVISFFDNVYSEEELANFTVRFTDNATNNTDKSTTASSAPTASNDDDKKFTQEDLDHAKDEAYWKGYDDSIDDSLNYYDDYSSSSSSSSSSPSNVETTTESSSSRSSSSSNVETTVG